MPQKTRAIADAVRHLTVNFYDYNREGNRTFFMNSQGLLLSSGFALPHEPVDFLFEAFTEMAKHPQLALYYESTDFGTYFELALVYTTYADASMAASLRNIHPSRIRRIHPVPARTSADKAITELGLYSVEASPTGLLKTADPGLLKLLGYTQRQVQGDGWIRILHPDDRDGALRRWYAHVQSGRGDWHASHRIVDVHNNAYHLEVLARPDMPDGIVRCWRHFVDLQPANPAERISKLQQMMAKAA
jgi:hypothetical protein